MKTKLNLKNTNSGRLEYAIDQYILGRNGERDRRIMRLHLIVGLPAEQIAEKFGMSSRQIYRIFVKRADDLIGKI